MKRILFSIVCIFLIPASFAEVNAPDKNVQLPEKASEAPVTTSSTKTSVLSLASAKDLRKILFVAVHPYNDFEKHRAKWGKVFSAYHIQWLDRSTGLNDVDYNIELNLSNIEAARQQGIFTASYFSQNPTEATPEWGFKVKYYKHLQPANHWRNPAGVPLDDPYEAAGSRDLAGQVVYAEGSAQTLGFCRNSRVAMSIFSPYWLEYQKASIAYVIGRGIDAIDIDSPGQVGSFYGMRGDFSDWFIKAFRDHLRKQVAGGRLHLPRTWQLDTFDIRAEFQKLLATVKNPDQLLNKSLIREWVIFNYSTLQDFHQSLNTYAKEWGQKTDKPYVPYYGNLHMGHPPYPLASANPSVLLGSCMDVIQIESVPAVPPLRLTTLHKLGIAMGNYSKPVWNLHEPYYGFSFEPKLPLLPSRSYEGLHQIYIAECYATGVVPEIDLGGWPGVTKAHALFVQRDGTPWPGLIPYFDFVFNHQDLFLDVEPYNKVALVYSVPTFTWNDLSLFGKNLGEFRITFLGLGRALEELHIPYDVLIFGQSRLWDDTDSLSRLSRYEAVVLPLIDCISNDQVKALRRYVAKGGRLFVTVGQEAAAKWNEKHILRTRSVLDWPAVHKIPADLVHNFYENSITNLRDDELNRQKLQTLLGNQPQLKTNASPRVGINVFTNGHRMIVHFVNHDYVAETDTVPPKESFTIALAIPETAKPKAVRWFSPELNSAADIPFRQTASGVSFQAPGLKVWAVAVVELLENKVSEAAEKADAKE